MENLIKSKLFICNTFYQLIMALHLKNTLFVHDKISVIITDQTKGMEKIIPKLEKLGMFEKVYFEKTKALCSKKSDFFSKINDILKMIKGDKKYKHIYVEECDELIYYNPDIFTHILFANMYKKNKRILCSRYEEGILSYGNEFKLFSKLIWARRIRKTLKKNNLEESTKYFYCCYPENYFGTLKVVKVPTINQHSNVGKMLLSLFDVNIQPDDYKEKYIFFTSVYDYEGGSPIGEYDVVEKIAHLVGKNNILIKQHPRDERTIYTDGGYKVARNSSMPWEVIQLGYDFSDKILLTVNSSSVLSANLIMTNGPKAFFVYKFCDLSQNMQAQATAKLIANLLDNRELKSKMTNVCIAEKIEEILVS